MATREEIEKKKRWFTLHCYCLLRFNELPMQLKLSMKPMKLKTLLVL